MAATVAVVVWTYGRAEVASECVRSVLAQQHAPRRIVVVDSASPDGTATRLAAEFPQIEVVRLDTNEGMGAAVAEGLQRVLNGPDDLIWFVEDDSLPAPTTLGRLVALLELRPEIDVVGPRGARWRAGRWHWWPRDRVGPCDFCMLDGALVRAAAARRVDPPRRDFFIMHVDVDYPLRLRRAGARSYQAGDIGHGARQLGAGSGATQWRAYYQTRNHLRMAIDQRSVPLLWGFVVRTAGQLVADARAGAPGWRRARFRRRGIVDALRGRMGRTVEPGG